MKKLCLLLIIFSENLNNGRNDNSFFYRNESNKLESEKCNMKKHNETERKFAEEMVNSSFKDIQQNITLKTAQAVYVSFWRSLLLELDEVCSSSTSSE